MGRIFGKCFVFGFFIGCARESTVAFLVAVLIAGLFRELCWGFKAIPLASILSLPFTMCSQISYQNKTA